MKSEDRSLYSTEEIQMNITATTASLLQNTDFNLNVSMDVKRNANFVFIRQPLRATPNEELPSIYVEKLQNGGRNSQKALRVPFLLQWDRLLEGGDELFQVVWRTDLEVHLERTQNYCVELLALYLQRMII